MDELKATRLRNVDALILAAHGYSGALGTPSDKATPSEVVGALKKGKLPKKAILFIFACSAATSHELKAFRPKKGRGPRMVFAATRLCGSHPMRDALESVVKAVIKDNGEGKLDADFATSITKMTGCVWKKGKWREPKTEFLAVIPEKVI